MHYTLPILAALANLIAGQELGAFLNDNPSTSAFWRAIRDYPDVLADIENASEVTLLVPSNDAMQELDLESQNDTQIQLLLRYHVLEDAYSVEELLSEGPFFPTLLTGAGVSGGQRVQVAGSGDTINIFSGLNNNASVDSQNSDLEFDGGIAHLIDTVLTVPQGVLVTAAAANLTFFAAAVNASDVDVEAEDDCTFFVPTNEAFTEVGSVFANASDEDIDNLVLYHFINDTTPIYTPRIDHEQWISALRENVTMSYLNGDELFINSARVTQANILVENGVIHVLDQVLNPEDAGGDPPTEAESSPAYPDAEPDEEFSFAEDAETSEQDTEEPVGDGPEATPTGTLSDDSEEGGSEGAENGGQRLCAGLSLSAAAVALAMGML